MKKLATIDPRCTYVAPRPDWGTVLKTATVVALCAMVVIALAYGVAVQKGYI